MMRVQPLRHAAHGAVLATLCLLLGACTGAGDPAAASLEQTVAAPAGPARMVALAPAASSTPAQAVASLPAEAGAVASVRAKTYVDGFRQDIVLRGSPIRSVSNGLAVLVRTSGQATLDESVPLSKPTEAAIRSEIGAQFPHIAMQVIERPSSNDYGPYGLALGRAAGDVHCLYMWQWIDANRLPRETKLAGPVSVRIRLCQAGTTFDAMAAMVGHLTIAMPTGEAVAADTSSHVIVASAEPAPKKPARREHVAHRAKPVVARVASVAEVAPQAPIYQPAPLAGDLPPQAYQGPRAGTAGKMN